MSRTSEAAKQCKKAMKMGLSLFHRGFDSSKCKTLAKMAVGRMKLLRNKREVVIRQMRRDIAMLLDSRQDATARIRVEHVIREQNIMVANEFLELFCELIVTRLSIIAKQRECPADLKEGISSLIFAAPRCSDIPELLGIRDVFKKRYGKDFVSAATDLRPNACVNRMLIEKLSVRTPSGEVKLKVLKEIANEYKVDWDMAESEMELLKSLEEVIDGPSTFVNASSFPINPGQEQPIEPNRRPSRQAAQDNSEDNMCYKDSATAAEAAAEAAKRAIDAAQAAAYLSSKDTHITQSNISVDAIAVNGNHDINATLSQRYGLHGPSHSDGTSDKVVTTEARLKRGTTSEYVYSSRGSHSSNDVAAQKTYRQNGYIVTRPAHSDNQFDQSDCDEEIEVEKPPSFDDLPSNQSDDANTRHMMLRWHSHNSYSANPRAMFDASDDEHDTVEESIRGIKLPPNRPAPPAYLTQNSVPSHHRKLPDLDSLAGRFEALKYQKFQP